MSDSPATLTGALADLARWLEGERIPGVVIGGVAASLLGRPRLTRDIDVAVLADDIGWNAVVDSARRYDIEPRVDDPIEFAARSRVLLLRHSPSSVEIDVSLGVLPFEREMIARARTVEAGSFRVPVPTVEDLIIMKALARRPRDWDDVDGLLDATPDLDLDRVRYWLRDFASILEMPEIQEDFEAVLRRKRGRS